MVLYGGFACTGTSDPGLDDTWTCDYDSDQVTDEAWVLDPADDTWTGPITVVAGP